LQLLHLPLHLLDLSGVDVDLLRAGRTCREDRSGRQQPPMTSQHFQLSCSLLRPVTPRHLFQKIITYCKTITYHHFIRAVTSPGNHRGTTRLNLGRLTICISP
jgi:hypothetical protein